MNITEYCDALNLDLVVRYYNNQENRWCARIDGVEVSKGAVRIGYFASGDSAEDAIREYVRDIRGEIIVYCDENGVERRNIVPNSLRADGEGCGAV